MRREQQANLLFADALQLLYGLRGMPVTGHALGFDGNTGLRKQQAQPSLAASTGTTGFTVSDEVAGSNEASLEQRARNT